MRETQTLYFNYVNDQKYTSAAELFHYPQNIDDREYINEVNRISKCIELVAKELGTIERVTSVPQYGNYRISFSGSNTDYGRKVPFYTAAHFPVKFDKSGKGWVEFNYYKESWRTLSIREISFRVYYARQSFQQEIGKYGGNCLLINLDKESSRYLHQID